jgi:hypothetical protein
MILCVHLTPTASIRVVAALPDVLLDALVEARDERDAMNAGPATN